MSDATMTSNLLVELSSEEQQLLAGGFNGRVRRDEYDRRDDRCPRGYDDDYGRGSDGYGRRGDRYDDRYYDDYTPSRRRCPRGFDGGFDGYGNFGY